MHALFDHVPGTATDTKTPCGTLVAAVVVVGTEKDTETPCGAFVVAVVVVVVRVVVVIGSCI